MYQYIVRMSPYDHTEGNDTEFSLLDISLTDIYIHSC